MTSTEDRTTFPLSDLVSRLEGKGLAWLGSFPLDEGEHLFAERAAQPSRVAIIGNVGSMIWPVFDQARQQSPDLTLDRWTEEVVGHIATEFSLDAVFPFNGPPYHPFIRWAKRTGALFSSPLGLTIHPTYGLWLAFRAALLIDHELDEPEVMAGHPCDDCSDRPCLSTCPVNAFTAEGYKFEACLNHVAMPVNACRQSGCLARIACPVGQHFRYQKPHAAFHMQELLKAHDKM